ISLKLVDAGVNHDFPDTYKSDPSLIQAKMGMGTKNFLYEPAMTESECLDSMIHGANIVDNISKTPCNTIAFGEMGIGNTASASVIMSKICDLPIDQCVGRGTGLDDPGVNKKIDILSQAIARHSGISSDPIAVLSTFGGYELAMMTGAMLKAASLRMIILVDGFISSSAFLIAHSINKNIMDYALFCHESHERGHQKMLSHLKAKPLLNLEIRLGEGTGCCLALPIIQSALLFLREMATFDSAGVSKSNEKTH
ncbi:MAG: nicotinate-nucleotide--dimethylbenzimidazole phosphoribosyltransferase, partial [Spirochaetota bacterium]|nr:nicotinate-nucleotide--dimethylbenzimidazole phosphoribosyltransferase [Spirochaetota bacterium]